MNVLKQFKIGIIGTESAHAHGFGHYFNVPDEQGNFLFPDCHVTLVYGDYPEENERIVTEKKADAVAKSIQEMVENVDAIMITSRDGDKHLEQVKPFLEAGIPVFLDKPVTFSPEEAVAIMQLAKKNHVPVCGGSSLKYAEEICSMKEKVDLKTIRTGLVSAPLMMDSPYGGYYFYVPHLIEMMLEMFGFYPKSVMAVEQNKSICAIVSYDGFSVTNQYNHNSFDSYAVGFVSDKEMLFEKVNANVCAKKECETFVEMLRTGKMPRSYQEQIIPVIFADALKKSYETKQETLLDYNIIQEI